MKAPIKGFNKASYPKGNVTQYFGENPELYGRVVCKDDRGKQYCLAGHNGVDIVAPWGTPIYAVEDGLVVNHKASPDGYGKHIKIVNYETGHEWTYGHLSRIDVDLNQEMKAGDQIGLMGNTGFVISGATPYWEVNPYAGTHLHLGLRLISNGKTGTQTTYHNGMRAHVIDWRNGYFGAVDWMPLWESSDPDYRQKQLTVISLANTVITLLQKLIAKKQEGK